MRTNRMILTASLAWLLYVAVPLINARVDIKPGFNSFSPQQDVELGQQAAKQVQQQFQTVNDAQLSDYISRLGRRLASFAPGYKFPYQFKAVNAKQINAFALPGGPIYLHTGTIAAAANEAQLAGVIAHEIAHIALRHSTNQASKAMLAQVPLAVLGGVLSGGGLAGQLAQLGISFGVNSAFLKFSRTAETQADQLGAQIMYDAGYDPRAMAQFFEVIKKQGGNQSLEFLSDHPSPGNRIASVEGLIPKLGPAKRFTNDSGEFEQMKRQAAALKAPAPTQSQRSSAGPPPEPSRNMRRLDADFVSIGYPDNWQAYGGQGTGSVTIAPEGGIISGGQGAAPEIAYGAVSGMFQPADTGRRLTLQDATDQLIAQLQQGNPHMHVAPDSRSRQRVDGQDAHAIGALGQSPIRGQEEMDWIVTTFRPEGLWYIVFISPEQSWDRYKPVFEQMLASVRFPR